MGSDRYPAARLSGNTITVDRGKERTLEFVLSADGGTVEGKHKSPDGTLALSLARWADARP